MRLLERPRFKPSYTVCLIGGEGVFLLSGGHCDILTGDVHEALAPLLDGSPTDAVVDRLSGTADPSHVYYALLDLQARGHLVEAQRSVEPDAGRVHRTTGAALIDAACPGRIDPIDVSGPPAGHPGHAATLDVVLTRDLADPSLEVLNRGSLDTGRPWLLAGVEASRLLLGPLFVPGRTACWTCMRHRLLHNRPVQRYLEARAARVLFHASVVPPSSLNPRTMTILAETADRWLRTCESDCLNRILAIDLPSGARRSHVIARRPQCAVCGDPNLERTRGRSTIRLQSRAKSESRDGGHRSIDPRAFLARHADLIDPLTGIAPNVKRMAFDAPDLHVYVAGSSPVPSGAGLERLRFTLRSRCSGKGEDAAQARASALGESIERHAGVFQGSETIVRASLDALGAEAIHPNACMLFSDAQYADREAWNRKKTPFAWVPEPFDAGREMDWTPVWPLAGGAHRYLPTAYLYYGHPEAGSIACCRADSNGCAAGATAEEAVLQGLFELIERDAVAVWWYNRVPRPAVQLDGEMAERADRVRRAYRRMDRAFWMLDLTHDIGIPVFAAITRRRSGPEAIAFGFGAHLDPAVAAGRALSEMHQLLAASNAMQAAAGDVHEETLAWMQRETVARQPWFAPIEGTVRSIDNMSGPASADLLDDIDVCRHAIEARGIQTFVLDQTRPDVGVPVVKVIAPGMRHFWARYAPGRLFDVPVQMGWLDATRTENTLNPIPVFF